MMWLYITGRQRREKQQECERLKSILQGCTKCKANMNNNTAAAAAVGKSRVTPDKMAASSNAGRNSASKVKVTPDKVAESLPCGKPTIAEAGGAFSRTVSGSTTNSMVPHVTSSSNPASTSKQAVQQESRTLQTRPPVAKKAPVTVLVSADAPTNPPVKDSDATNSSVASIVTGSAQKVGALKAVFENKSTSKSEQSRKLVSPNRGRLSTKNRASRDLSSAFQSIKPDKKTVEPAQPVEAGTSVQLSDTAAESSTRRPKRGSSGGRAEPEAKRPCHETVPEKQTAQKPGKSHMQ